MTFLQLSFLPFDSLLIWNVNTNTNTDENREFSVSTSPAQNELIHLCGWHEHNSAPHSPFVNICWLQSFEIRVHNRIGLLPLRNNMVAYFWRSRRDDNHIYTNEHEYDVLQSRRSWDTEASRSYVEPGYSLNIHSLVLVGCVHDCVIRSSLCKGIHNRSRTSMGNVQNRTKCLPTVIIHTIAYLAMVVHRSAW